MQVLLQFAAHLVLFRGMPVIGWRVVAAAVVDLHIAQIALHDDAPVTAIARGGCLAGRNVL